jgi:endogenous inhibitor of DNA gyrase (YacG/DUF329 family)
MTVEVSCPQCKKSVLWQASSAFRPFCCKRCQLIDLGEWAGEEKRIKGEPVSPENITDGKTIYFE